MVSVDLVEVPLHHLLSYRDIQRLEGVFHQFPELFNVDQLVFFSFLRWLPAFLSSFSEEVRKLR